MTKERINEIFNKSNEIKMGVSPDVNVLDNMRSFDAMYMCGKTDEFEIKAEVDWFGGEGQGEEYWMVSKITDFTTGEVAHIRFNAYYNSWDGCEWQDWDIVEPKEVIVIKWVTEGN